MRCSKSGTSSDVLQMSLFIRSQTCPDYNIVGSFESIRTIYVGEDNKSPWQSNYTVDLLFLYEPLDRLICATSVLKISAAASMPYFPMWWTSGRR